MKGFCPNCGADAEIVKIKQVVHTMRVTKCNGCGCRVSWYGDGTVRVWYNGGSMKDVPEGLLLVNAGKRL